MARPRSVGTAEHWARAKELFGAGLVYKSIELRLREELGTIDGVEPPRDHTIRRRAVEEEWQRDEGVGLHVGPAVETSERAKERLEKFTVVGEIAREERLQKLTEEMTDAATLLIRQMFAPHTVKEAKVVAGPQGSGSDVEIVEIELDQPAPRDKQALAASAAQLIDRVMLLTGKATSRTESTVTMDRATAEARLRHVRDELAERRGAREAG